MPPIPILDHPHYEPFDLSTFSDDYAGRIVPLLVNPTKAFSTGFSTAASKAIFGIDGDVFNEYVAAIVGRDLDTVDDVVGELPLDVFRWLFLYTVDDYDEEKQRYQTVIKPYILEVWSDWVDKRVKAHAARR